MTDDDSRLLLTSPQTFPIEVQAVVMDFEMEQFPHGRFDLLDPGIAKLNHFAAVDADQMVMLLETV